MSTLRIIKGRIKNRRDTKEVFEKNNPLLYDGELCIEQDTNKLKCGDGVTRYIDLPYIGGNLPTGSVIPFAGTILPEDDWLLCNGQAVSRTDYADLYAIIGIKYGNGDGTTTFNVPNLNNTFIEATSDSSKVSTKLSASLPNITGSFMLDDNLVDSTGVNGGKWRGVAKQGLGDAIYFTGSRGVWDADSDSGQWGGGWVALDASKSSSVYSNSCTTVQPPAIMMHYIIKT